MSAASISSFLESIPEFQSGKRAAFFYGDVAPRKESDPDAYRAVVSFWQRVLENLLLRGLQPSNDGCGDKLVLHVDDTLLQSLRWLKHGRPLSVASAVVSCLALL
jgi:hypothetical protein